MSQPDTEQWKHRGKCTLCGAVIWVDTAARVACLCGASWIDASGLFGGATTATDDDEMAAFILADWGRQVAPIQTQG